MTLLRAALLLVPTLALASCATHSHQVVTPATDAQRADLLDSMKSLEGEWTMVDDKGNTLTAAVFSVSSSGSVVREIMFPGQPHEMTNVYHMDGPSMVVTHYCAGGNQPRMRARADSDPAVIVFERDGVSNLTKPEESYMGGLTLNRKDADTLTAHWTSYVGDKESGVVDFELKRKR